MVVLALSLGAVGFAPGEASARQSLSFSPGDHVRSHQPRAAHRGHAGRAYGRVSRAKRGRGHGTATRAPARMGRAARGDPEGDAAKAVPGKGFTLDNGVLTYPAPARFQPKNLRAR